MDIDPMHMSGLHNIEPKPDPVKEARKKLPKDKQEAAQFAAEEANIRKPPPKPAKTELPAPTPPPEPPPPELDRQAILDRITAYRERFPRLKQRNKFSVKSTDLELLDELHYIELQLGSNNGSAMTHQIFLATMSGLEAVTTNYYNPLNLNLTGLGGICRDNMDQFTDLLDEIGIKYGASIACPVELRLAIAVSTVVLTVHSANSGDGRLASSLSSMGQQVPESTKSKAKGL